MKTPVASITASIQDQNFLQTWMMTSLSRSVLTSEVMTLREARVIWGHLLTSLSTSHHMNIWRVTICWAGRPHFLQPVDHQAGLQLDLVVHDNGDILMVRTHLSVILSVCLAILVKIFPHQRRKLFGLDDVVVFWCAKVLHSWWVAYSGNIFLKKNLFFYMMSYQRCPAFQWDLQNISMITRCLNILIQKLS